MPLPGAEAREARVYALLKGQTLEALTGQLAPGEFLPEVGNPISVEALNEDESSWPLNRFAPIGRGCCPNAIT